LRKISTKRGSNSTIVTTTCAPAAGPCLWADYLLLCLAGTG
jgi:hypothetical protein